MHRSLHAINPALYCRWPGEVDLHRGVAGRLLPVLVRRRPVAARLARSPAWAALAGAWAAQARRIRAFKILSWLLVRGHRMK